MILLQGDDSRMQLVYFWSAVLLALTPVVAFAGLTVWVVRKYLRERKEAEREAGSPT